MGVLAWLALVLAVPVAAHPGQFAPAPRGASAPRAAPVPRAVPNRHPGHEEQYAARAALREGNVEQLRDIEQHVLPTMRGMQYLGPEYHAEAMAYRLKFIRNGRVVFVDVDGRTGQVLGRTR